MARSRAGLGLTMIALFGAFALGFSNRSAGFGAMSTNKLLLGAIVLVVIFSLQFALYRVLERIPDPLKMTDQFSPARPLKQQEPTCP